MQIKNNYLESFKGYMSLFMGWVQVSDSATLVVYQKQEPAKMASIIITILLLLVGIFPGIVYFIIFSRPARVHSISVSLDSEGKLMPSGTFWGMWHFTIWIKTYYKAPSKI